MSEPLQATCLERSVSIRYNSYFFFFLSVRLIMHFCSRRLVLHYSASRLSEAAEQRLFVLPVEFISFFISQADISVLAGRIFVILVSFDRVLLNVLDSI